MNKDVLTPGANAGLGLETARQLAVRSDIGRIFVSARGQDKADNVTAHVVAQTGQSAARFAPVLIDLFDRDSIHRALEDTSLVPGAFNASLGSAWSGPLVALRRGLMLQRFLELPVRTHAAFDILCVGPLFPGTVVVAAGDRTARTSVS